MSLDTIIGHAIGGFACKLYGAAGAVWLALEVTAPLRHASAQVTKALAGVG